MFVKLCPLMIVLTLVACRVAKVGKESPAQGGGIGNEGAVASPAPIVQPQRQSDSGKELALQLDGSGILKTVLTLRLDYFPTPRSDGVSIPTCYNELPGHMVIGRIYCGSNGNIAQDVTVSQVQQQCFTGQPPKKIVAKSAIVLAGCTGPATLRTYHFEPEIKLE